MGLSLIECVGVCMWGCVYVCGGLFSTLSSCDAFEHLYLFISTLSFMILILYGKSVSLQPFLLLIWYYVFITSGCKNKVATTCKNFSEASHRLVFIKLILRVVSLFSSWFILQSRIVVSLTVISVSPFGIYKTDLEGSFVLFLLVHTPITYRCQPHSYKRLAVWYL